MQAEAAPVRREPVPPSRTRPDDAGLTDLLLAPVLERRRWWWIAFLACLGGTVLLAVLSLYTAATGIGVWGDNIPVGWGIAITNLVWWGHAGAVVSAALLLLDQRWRAPISRIAETAGLAAVACAGIFPILHLGRPWLFYWLIPYPNSLEVWPQFRSALTWDMNAILVLLTVSFLFWYLGILPDLATLRDRTPGIRRRRAYGVFALGWKGSGRDWHQYRIAYGLLAALLVVVSVSTHSISSLDFATALLPGWHRTIFPPYFFVRMVYTAFALVGVLAVLLRRPYRLEGVVTVRHLDRIAKVLLALAWVVLYTYAVEHFVAWYEGAWYERHTYLAERPAGPYAVLFWTMVILNVVVPQLFWSARLRRSPWVVCGVGLLVLAGVWMERFVIVVASLNRGFLPSAWSLYTPSWVEWGILAGTLSLFGLLFLVAIRLVPPVAIHEVKRVRRMEPREDG